MELLDLLLGQQKIGTPGINPNAPDPRPNKPMGQLDAFLQQPGGSMLMNLLAQSGRSLTPGPSPLGAIGRAALTTQAQQQQRQRSGLENEFLRSQIGLNKAKAELPSGGQRRVQSAQPLANGNIGYLDAFTGQVVDTGFKAGGKGQVIDMPGIGQVIYDPVQQTLTEVNPEEVIRTAGAERRGAEQRATSEAQADVTAEIELPGQIAKDQEFIEKGERFINMLESGELNTGPIVGQAPPLSTNAQLFQAFSGENVIQSISSATFGQLSEGERKFIETTNPSRKNTEAANIDIIKTKIEYIKRAQERARQRLDKASGEVRRRRYNPETGQLEDI